MSEKTPSEMTDAELRKFRRRWVGIYDRREATINIASYDKNTARRWIAHADDEIARRKEARKHNRKKQ